MHSARILKLLVAALSATSATNGFIIDAALLGRHGRELVARQGGANNAADASGSGNTVAAVTPAETTESVAATTAETTETTSAAAPATTAEPTTTTSAPAAETTTSAPTTDAPSPSTTSSQPAATTSASADTTQTTGTDSATTTDAPTSTTAAPVTSTTVVIVTASDGSVSSSTSLSVSTPTAALSSGSGSGSSGMSQQTKNTIIGVVVGVGGAIVLAVAGVFAWRIWGRKRNSEENDGLMGFNNGAEGKSEVGTGLGSAAATGAGGRSPFTDTLESYHGPTAKPNTAANF